jgi:hypothetical protein
VVETRDARFDVDELAHSAERITPGTPGSSVASDSRDIFTMDARPVLSLDSLRFGPIHGDTEQHSRSRFAGVVSGIAHCGNCIGVPTIGGEG